ncbi:hypothetical protein [Qipengyuania marisflavi]|uniref:Uncharacterized protein n=1 Tax=Qipengyuania marisflavi TaxID=2486356 RepID=A0A5S3P8W3_9SPHN|nr:hypothetical protein [Qipengyuania marisflavi]TMM49753.1 hypothetical protein FEV51_00690 [Qipengyuania marisflavi]
MGKSIASRFENVDIEKSCLLGVIIDDDELILEMDFCLDPAHIDYEDPGEGETCCFHPGMLRFAGISTLQLDRADVETKDGIQRRFAIASFKIEGTRFDMSCEWGDIHLQARSIRVITD